jgi:flavin reductase (DIM6/NTAB) family NADH-FMN oxidoreductase RutF
VAAVGKLAQTGALAFGALRTISLGSDVYDASSGVDTVHFKLAARRFASGVTVVTTRVGEVLHGGTVSAFFSLSLDPLQVLVSLSSGGRLAELVRQSGCFAVNVLSAKQEALSRLFASTQRPTTIDELPAVTTERRATGAPIIRDCLAFFDCTVSTAIASGDHTLFIGLVQAVGETEGQPLLYFDGAYRTLGAFPVDPV